jgi:LysR family transcriptional regulator, regulator for metE and metH
MSEKKGPAMYLEIRHLKLVAAIAETGSVTHAGNMLHLTQSALSHQLRYAEEQVGSPLFARQNRKMVITAAGERLLQTAKNVLAELERAARDIQERNAGSAGLIRLSTQCYTVYHWLPLRLKLFQKRFPEVEFQLVVEATDNPFRALLEGTLDLAIVCDPIRNRKIVYTPLFEDELFIIVAPEHSLAGKKYLIPENLAGENLIIYPPKEECTVLKEILEPAGISPRKIQEVMLTEAIIEMVIAGLGVASLPGWAAAPQLASGAVIGLPLTAHGFHRTWSAAQLRDRTAPVYLQEFIRLLEERPLTEDFSRPGADSKNLKARRNAARGRATGAGLRRHEPERGLPASAA